MYITDNGIRLSAELEKPEGADRCPLVIVLHGFGSAKNRIHTLQTAEAMRDAGFATLRADLYGHGESDGLFRQHTVGKWVSNTLALIRYAQGLDFVTDIWLSGHSQGGLTAALAAGKVPDEIRGLILRAPAFMLPRGAREGNLLGYRFDPEHIPDTVPLYDDLVLDGEYLRDAQTIHAEEAMDRYHGPVLILHGDADDVVPAEDSRKAAARYTHCELAEIPGETHHFDRYPEVMIRRIRDFCRRESGKC